MSRMRLTFEGDGGSDRIGISGISEDTSFGGGSFYKGTVLMLCAQDIKIQDLHGVLQPPVAASLN